MAMITETNLWSLGMKEFTLIRLKKTAEHIVDSGEEAETCTNGFDYSESTLEADEEKTL